MNLNFLKRKDLTAEKRLEIGLLAFQAKGVYGEITRISNIFACSRQFVYLQLWALLSYFELNRSEFDSGYDSTSEEFWIRLVLLLKLENTASIKSISRTLKYLELRNNSVGCVSQRLQKWGSFLESTLSTEDTYPILVNSDEIYAAGKPILVTIEPVSMAIIKMEIAEDCKGVTWEKQLKSVQENGFWLNGVVSDQGKGLVCGTKLAELDWNSDQFHELQLLTKIVEKTIYNQAHKAVESLTKDDNEENLEKAERCLDSYDAHDYLRRVILRSLPFLDHKGKFRDPDWVEGEVTAALELMIELGHKKAKPQAEKLLERLPEILKYFNKIEELKKEIVEVCPNAEIAQCFCLLWNHRKGVVVQRGELRKYHRKEKVTWEQLLEMELGNSYNEIRDFIFKKLDSVPRTSSLVEAVNSLIRPYLNSCKRITQEMLNLIMFRHNYHLFAEGKRKNKAPIEILTGELLLENWVELLVKKFS